MAKLQSQESKLWDGKKMILGNPNELNDCGLFPVFLIHTHAWGLIGNTANWFNSFAAPVSGQCNICGAEHLERVGNHAAAAARRPM